MSENKRINEMYSWDFRVRNQLEITYSEARKKTMDFVFLYFRDKPNFDNNKAEKIKKMYSFSCYKNII